jgi:hypothetical protein
MPSKVDKIFRPIEAQIGGGKSKIGYYEDLNLAEGEQQGPKNKNVIGAGVGYDYYDKKPFLYAEGKKDSFSGGIEAKSKDEYSGNIGYDVDENTKVAITANKDDFSKSVNIGINKKFKGGGFIAKGCGKVMKDRKKVTKMY